MTGQMPQIVKIKNSEGNIIDVPYRELKEHEEAIIEDNIMYGRMHGEYSQKEILDYAKQASQEWKELKKKLRENPEIILIMDDITERFVPYVEDPEDQTDNIIQKAEEGFAKTGKIIDAKEAFAKFNGS